MLYCEHCKNLFDDGMLCPFCGNESIRAPKADDFCFFTECDEGRAVLCRDLLAEGDIPCVLVPATAPVRAALGLFLRNFRVFVPFGGMEEARAVLAAFTEGEEESEDEGVK